MLEYGTKPAKFATRQTLLIILTILSIMMGIAVVDYTSLTQHNTDQDCSTELMPCRLQEIVIIRASWWGQIKIRNYKFYNGTSTIIIIKERLEENYDPKKVTKWYYSVLKSGNASAPPIITKKGNFRHLTDEDVFRPYLGEPSGKWLLLTLSSAWALTASALLITTILRSKRTREVREEFEAVLREAGPWTPADLQITLATGTPELPTYFEATAPPPSYDGQQPY